jgi:GNAT superfamily N-acetyltransferase
MPVTVRNGTADDMKNVHALVMQLAIFEKAPEEVITDVETLQKDGYGERDNFRTLIAEDENKQVIGICLYYIAYSSWKGRILFLDDIVIDEPYRSQGVGTLLMNALFNICKEEHIKQMRWQVLDWNEPAIKFYEKLGAFIDKDWYTCKMNF